MKNERGSILEGLGCIAGVIFKGVTAPDTSPITRIEVLEEEN